MSELVTLSASKLKTHSMCPRKFWYSYVKKEPQKRHPAAVMGSAVHRTIEHVYKNPEEGTVPGVLYQSFFEEEAAKSEVVHDQRYYIDGLKIVANYNFDLRTPVQLEYEFRLPFPNQAHPICIIHGYIDQAYDWGLVDLKTSRAKPLIGMLNYDLQFIIYAWAFREIYGYDPTVVYWHHLRTGDDLPADVLNKTDHATAAITNLLSADLYQSYPRSVGEHCRYCPFRTSCLGRED